MAQPESPAATEDPADPPQDTPPPPEAIPDDPTPPWQPDDRLEAGPSLSPAE